MLAAISQVKPQSSTGSTKNVEQNVDDAGAPARYESLMQLITDRIESGERETESEVARRDVVVSFLTERPHYEYRENEILNKVTEFSEQNVNQLDVGSG